MASKCKRLSRHKVRSITAPRLSIIPEVEEMDATDDLRSKHRQFVQAGANRRVLSVAGTIHVD